MPIPQQEIERIKRERSVVEWLPHHRRVGRALVALCPLPGHQEKTGSFHFYPEDGGYKCYGCGRAGVDVIRFYAHLHDLRWPGDFPRALSELGAHLDRASWRYPTLPSDIKTQPAQREVWPALPGAEALAIYRVAAEVWAANLWRPTNHDALAYVRGRGIPDALIRDEWIGVSTDTLGAELQQRGLSLETAQSLGLLRRDGRETFTGRITFIEWRLIEGAWSPVWATARTYGQGAAWDAARKYLNVRGDRLVCGLDRARHASTVVLVEGAFDRLAVLSFGDAAVCLGSNQPSAGMQSELRALARGRRLILLCDGDRAGRKGCLRTLAEMRLPPGAWIAVATLPPGIKDPGALAERPDGAALYRESIAQARHIDLDRFARLCAACHTAYESRRAAHAHATAGGAAR